MTKAEMVAKLTEPGTLYARQLMRRTKRELEAMLERRENRRYRQTVELGTVRTFDRQADIFGGQYEIIAFDDRTGQYTARYLEPSDALIEAAAAYYLHADPNSWCAMGYHDPFGPERRLRTPQEALDNEILDRIENAGREFKIRFVSAAEYAAAF